MSDKNYSDFFGLDSPDAPVVEVVVKEAVTCAELERLEEGLVLHDVECVEYVEFCFLGLSKEV